MIGKKLKISLLAAFGLAAAAMYLEVTGYNDFNTAAGNTLCNLDDACRRMTPGEIKAAREVFGDKLDYSRIKIFNRPNYSTYPFKAMLDLFGNAETPNGNVYFEAPESYAPDMSKDPKKMPLLLHELTHAWQYQSGKNMLIEGIKAFINAGYKYSNAYKYDLDDNKTYKSLGIEQQAEMVQNYSDLRLSYKRSPYKDAWRSFYCQRIEKYEAKIGKDLPLHRLSACKPTK